MNKQELEEICSYIMNGSYVHTSETTKKTDLCIFCQKVKQSENFSSSSTGREKLLNLSNKITR